MTAASLISTLRAASPYVKKAWPIAKALWTNYRLARSHIGKRRLGEAFPVHLDLRDLGGDLVDKPFLLLSDFYFIRPNGEVVTAEEGNRTDFGSVPRFFWRVISPFGPSRPAFVVHDAECDANPKRHSSHEASIIMLEAMCCCESDTWKIAVVTTAVQFGGPTFNQGDTES
ncbi:MAG: DUF1353 domain-containing protein [Puniceicoccaceae bacterium]